MWMAIVNPKSPENTPKNAKNNNLLRTKRIVNTKIQARWVPGFYISLPGAVRTPAPAPVSYATYQVHFKQ